MSCKSPLITHAGETLTLRQWAARAGISPRTLSKRLCGGVPVHLAVTLGKQPSRSRKPALALVRDDGVERGTVQRAWVATRCLEWSAQRGARLTDDEIADVAALVMLDRDVRIGVLNRGGDVAHLCRAVVARRHQTIARDGVGLAA